MTCLFVTRDVAPRRAMLWAVFMLFSSLGTHQHAEQCNSKVCPVCRRAIKQGFLPHCHNHPPILLSVMFQVGPELPEPSIISWDPTLKFVALVYLRHVQVFRVQPTFESIGSLPMAGTNGAVWGIKQLYLSTPTQIVLVFVAAGEGHGQSLLEDVAMGSHQSTLTVRACQPARHGHLCGFAAGGCV